MTNTLLRDGKSMINEMLIKYVNKALDCLYEKDFHLIKYPALPINNNEFKSNKWFHVGERSIVFRFAHYLDNLISDDEDLRQLNVDCEYNRNGNQPKKLKPDGNGKYPDVILHERGSNEYNTLVIEFKGY